VFLLCLEDGRQSVVDVAKSICSRVKFKTLKTSELTPHGLDTIFQGNSLHDMCD